MEYFLDLLTDMVRGLTPLKVRKWIVKQKPIVYILYSILVYIVAYSIIFLGMYLIVRLCISLLYFFLDLGTCIQQNILFALGLFFKA